MKLRTLIAALMVATGCTQAGANEDLGWSTQGLGSTFETVTVTHLQDSALPDTVLSTRHTLLSKAGGQAALELEVQQPDGTSTHSRIERPLEAVRVDPGLYPGMTVKTGQERCVVPAGSFDCTWTTLEYHQGELTRSVTSWTAPGFPVPVRTVVSNERLTSTTELVGATAGT